MDEPVGARVGARPALGTCDSAAPQVTSDDEWRAARSYLAVEVLNLAAEFGPLAELQRRVLVPLEQRLASRPEVAGWRPRQWVESVEAALDKHRQACRRTMTRKTRPPR
jgi:hypothetical protein